MRVPIKLGEGVGDCLNEINRYPLHLFNAMGVGARFYLTTPTHPATPIVLPLLKHIIGAEISHNVFPPTLNQHRMANVLRKLFLKLGGDYRPPLRGISTKRSACQYGCIVVQTHMDGHHHHKELSAKIWSIENWILFMQGLSAATGCTIKLMEWDKDAKNKFMQAIPGIVDVTDGDLVDKCRIIRECDLLVSVDSWSKYVAHWFRTPQVVIVPDLRTNYTPGFGKTGGQMIADRYFVGLIDKPDIRLLGLERVCQKFEYSLPNMEALDPKYLLKESISIITQLRK